ncbi:PREDICTED: putative golgin subfamily A member 6C, partial [Mandrillus leucophaeus]|uniref:putative golgin subfamily A member 6C n=1 Tax=Mandrillus leucophaeus TaxID=9568 RepID=UPI0005F4C45E
MLEETRESKLAAAKKKIQDILKVLVSNLHHSGGSRYKELEVALDSSSATINQLNENIESLKQQKKQVEHQLEENNENKSALQLEQQVKELQEKLSEEHLEDASQQNQQLEAQLSLMAISGEGNEGGHLNGEEVEAPRLMPSIPKDLESQEATSSFMDLPKEKADRKEQVEKRELGSIQLSGA